MGHFGFSVQFFFAFFSPRPGRSRLTTWTKVKKNRLKNRDFFLKKKLDSMGVGVVS
jgi:hypothetical protein